MTVVWKYPITGPLFKMPTEAKIVHCGVQHNIPTMWVECDPGNPPEMRRFEMYPTGGQLPDGVEHRGTFLLDGGAFVLHLYELSV